MTNRIGKQSQIRADAMADIAPIVGILEVDAIYGSIGISKGAVKIVPDRGDV